MHMVDLLDSHSWQSHSSIDPPHNEFDKFLPMMSLSIDSYHWVFDIFSSISSPSKPYHGRSIIYSIHIEKGLTDFFSRWALLIHPHHRKFNKFPHIIGPSIDPHYKGFDKFPFMINSSIDLHNGRVQHISLHEGCVNRSISKKLQQFLSCDRSVSSYCIMGLIDFHSYRGQ